VSQRIDFLPPGVFIGDGPHRLGPFASSIANGVTMITRHKRPSTNPLGAIAAAWRAVVDFGAPVMTARRSGIGASMVLRTDLGSRDLGQNAYCARS